MRPTSAARLGDRGADALRKSKTKFEENLVRLEGETSNALFDTLAQWNDHLKASDLKGNDGPKP